MKVTVTNANPPSTERKFPCLLVADVCPGYIYLAINANYGVAIHLQRGSTEFLTAGKFDGDLYKTHYGQLTLSN